MLCPGTSFHLQTAGLPIFLRQRLHHERAGAFLLVQEASDDAQPQLVLDDHQGQAEVFQGQAGTVQAVQNQTGQIHQASSGSGLEPNDAVSSMYCKTT